MELTLDQALQKGVEAHKAGKVQEADSYYTAILKASPKHPDANHNMGVLAVDVGKVEVALPFFKTALETNPSIAQVWLSYIDALIKLDRITDALRVLDQAKIKGVKGDGFDQIEIRLTALIRGNQTDEEILEKAIDLRENGKYDEAIDLLLHQKKRSPTNPYILSVLSHCYILNDNLEKAKIYLDAAKNINANIATVRWNEIRILLKQKKVNKALAVAEKTYKLFPNDVEGIGVLGSCFRACGNFDESLRYLNQAIELNPSYAEVLIHRGLIYLAKKDKPNALTDLEKAHHLKPHIKQIWHLVLNLNIEINEFENVIALAERMIKIDPLDEKVFASVALCHQHLKNYAQAAVFYKKALSIKPDYAEAYNNMGIALKEQGKPDEAIVAYKKALSIKPDYAEANYGLAAILYEIGDSAGVMENLEHINSNVSELVSDNHALRLPYKLLRSIKYNEIENAIDVNKSKILINSDKFPLILERNVEDELIKCLYKLSARSLNETETKDARYGSGKCSKDFKLFETNEPIIKKVATELLKSMENLLNGTVLYHESFFNILGAGGGTKPHAHLKEHDSNFDLNKYKFSLVYYLSVGDQNCTEPGTLKLYEPNIDILPTKGMCVLIPATRKHSAIYNGSKDRVMIGCNFYLV